MVNVQIDLTREEHRKLDSMKGDRTLREILLEAVGVDFEPRRLGRPPRMVSHDVCGESAITDSHTVEGLDTGLMQERRLERMRRRKAGGI